MGRVPHGDERLHGSRAGQAQGSGSCPVLNFLSPGSVHVVFGASVILELCSMHPCCCDNLSLARLSTPAPLRPPHCCCLFSPPASWAVLLYLPLLPSLPVPGGNRHVSCKNIGYIYNRVLVCHTLRVCQPRMSTPLAERQPTRQTGFPAKIRKLDGSIEAWTERTTFFRNLM